MQVRDSRGTHAGTVRIVRKGQRRAFARRGLWAGAAAIACVVGLLSPSYAAEPPTITTSFPKVADVGTSVTVRGTGFSTTASQNVVTVNGVPVTLTQSRADHVKFTVPAGATSGPLRIQTSGGSAEWVDDLYVPPADHMAADISTSRRAVPGAAAVVARVTDPGQLSMVTVPATAGSRVALHLTHGTFGAGAASMTVRGPDGTVVAGPTTFGDLDTWVEPFPVGTSGTYTVVVDPAGAAIGKVDVASLVVPPDSTVSAQAGGPAVTAAVSNKGQNATVTFTGAVGQRVSFGFANNTFVNSFSNVQVRLVSPSGQVVLAPRGLRPEMFVDVRRLDEAGVYRLVVDPVSTATGQTDVVVHDVPADTVVNGALDHRSELLPNTVPGQNATLRFEGAANQRVAVDLDEATLPGGPGTGLLRLLRPSGATLAEATITGGRAFLDPVALPVNGTYTVVVDADGAGTGGAGRAHPLLVPADARVSVLDDGAEHQASVTVPGSRAAVEVVAFPGGRAALHLTQSTFAPGTPVSVTHAGGTTTHEIGSDGRLFVGPLTVPASGTITALVDPVGNVTGSTTVRALGVDDDLSDEVGVGGAGSWELGVGQRLNLDLRHEPGGTSTGRLHPAVSWFSVDGDPLPLVVTPIAPDGQAGTSVTVAVGADPTVLDVLREQAGTYQLLLDPAAQAVGVAEVTLWDGEAEVATAEVDGAPVLVRSAPGRSASVGFSVAAPAARGTAVDRQERREAATDLTTPRLAVLLRGSTYNPDDDMPTAQRASAATSSVDGPGPAEATVQLTGPDGMPLTGAERLGTDHFIEPFAAAPGTYTVDITPTDARGGSAGVAVFSVPDDLSTDLELDGAPTDFVTATGQDVAITTDALPADTDLTVRLVHDRADARLTVIDPLGHSVVDGSELSVGGALRFTTGAAGAYRIEVNPQGAANGPWTAELYSHTGTPVFEDGGAADWTTEGPSVRWSVAEDDAGWAVLVDGSPDADPGTEVTTDDAEFSGPLPDGEHWIHVRAVLPDGRFGRVAHHRVRLDTTAPAVLDLASSTHPDPTSAVAARAFVASWSGEDPHSGVVGYSVSLGAPGEVTAPDEVVDTADATWAGQVPGDGPWTFAVRAVDAVGLWSEPSTLEIAVDVDAPGSPVVRSTTHPVAGSTSRTFVASLTPAAAFDDVVAWAVAVDQAPVTDPSGPSTGESHVRRTLTPGTWWLHVKAQDRAGRWSATTHHEVVVLPATVAVLAPVPGQVIWTSREIAFVCLAQETYGVRLTGPVTKVLGPITGTQDGRCETTWNPHALTPDGDRVYPDGQYDVTVLADDGTPVTTATVPVSVARLSVDEAMVSDQQVGLLTEGDIAQSIVDEAFGSAPTGPYQDATDGDLSTLLMAHRDELDPAVRAELDSLGETSEWEEPGARASMRASGFVATCRGPQTISRVPVGIINPNRQVQSRHFDVRYKSNQITADPAGGCPVFLREQIDALEAAYATYSAYDYDLPDRLVVIFEEHIKDRSGITPGNFIVMDPDGEQLSHYLPQHELMHVAQFQNLKVSTYSYGETRWWLEAVADWAAGEAQKHPISPGTNQDYAQSLNNFLAGTDQDLTRTADHAGYGAFVLAKFIQEEHGPDAVRQVTEGIGTSAYARAPIALLKDRVELRGRNFQDEIERFRWFTYGLDEADAPDLGFSTPDVRDHWRTALDRQVDPDLPAGRTPYQSVSLVEAGSKEGHAVLGPGGSRFVELTVPDGTLGRLVLTVDAPHGRGSASVTTGRIVQLQADDPLTARDELQEKVVTCAGGSGPVGAAEEIGLAGGAGTVSVVLSETCPTAMLQLHSPMDVSRAVPGFPGSSTRLEWTATLYPTGAVLEAGLLKMGVTEFGHLIVGDVGLRRSAVEVIANGCSCEGWGVGNRSISAGVGGNGNGGDTVAPVSFLTSDTEAESVVDVLEPATFGKLRVTHSFRPSSDGDLFQVDVTVTNTSTFTPVQQDVHYRRVFDWDVEPTPFSEYVTWGKFAGANDAPVHFTSDDGFAVPDPGRMLTHLRRTGYFADLGPADSGGLIDIELGDIGYGQSASFTFYYGVAPTESDAIDALQAVGADVYSFGQSNSPGGPTLGTPATAIFGLDTDSVSNTTEPAPPLGGRSARAAGGPQPDGGSGADQPYSVQTQPRDQGRP